MELVGRSRNSEKLPKGGRICGIDVGSGDNRDGLPGSIDSAIPQRQHIVNCSKIIRDKSVTLPAVPAGKAEAWLRWQQLLRLLGILTGVSIHWRLAKVVKRIDARHRCAQRRWN